MKKIIAVLCICILAMIFTACGRGVVMEEFEWKLESAKSFKNPSEKISVGEVYLVFNDGDFVINDKTNNETYNGAYEELYMTENEDDYRVIVEGARGHMEMFESDDEDEEGKIRLRLTLDEYDLCFVRK